MSSQPHPRGFKSDQAVPTGVPTMNVPVQRKPNGQLLPGFTANPSGRPKVVGEIKELARQRSYYIPRSGGGGRGLPPGYVCKPLPVERIWWDIPLDAKLSIGQRIYNGCKAAEEVCSNDDTRVATLLAEAQLEMLRDPFAAFASLRSGNEPPPSRAQRIEALVEFFEMMMPGRRSGGRSGALGRVPDHIKEQYGCCLPATRTLM